MNLLGFTSKTSHSLLCMYEGAITRPRAITFDKSPIAQRLFDGIKTFPINIFGFFQNMIVESRYKYIFFGKFHCKICFSLESLPPNR